MGGIRADCRAPVKAATAKGHTLKHARAAKTKHHHTTKHHPAHHAKSAVKHAHHVHTKAKHATHAKSRGLALAIGDVACCTIEPLAASLRLQGLPVADSAVLDLFRLAGGDEDKGLPVVVALEAASEFGLAGYRPVFEEVMPRESAPDCHDRSRSCCWCCPDAADLRGVSGAGQLRASGLILGLELPGPHAVEAASAFGLAGVRLVYAELEAHRVGERVNGVLPVSPGDIRVEPRHVLLDEPAGLFDGALGVHALILGVDLPGAHTVLATPEGWWSWGQLWCPCEFPDAVIEEAWAISWAVAE